MDLDPEYVEPNAGGPRSTLSMTFDNPALNIDDEKPVYTELSDERKAKEESAPAPTPYDNTWAGNT